MYELKPKKEKKPTYQGCKGGAIFLRPKQQSRPPIRTDYKDIEKPATEKRRSDN